MFIQSLFGFFAALGFGILFNIKGNKLFYAGLGGGLSWFISIYCESLGFNTTSSFFISAIIFSIYSEIMARILKTPVTTLIICALIPLVPGGGMYYTMYEAINGNIMESIEIGLDTISNAGSLALGILFVSTLTRLLMLAKRKREFKEIEKISKKKRFRD
ncbi:threonine/serine exporter family protein [Clostridium sp. AL.422]|uniref:threonine/serine exporter family protein n=1 Tax=Clostridium TaxID=1485 RepID=UPI00293DC09A|nr:MULTISPECIES: threonine/serine exporter family protein [unclassified Clostridium]MDV4152422.1 threonine/serine exporter family protein [Clostridium sp. AL.422]